MKVPFARVDCSGNELTYLKEVIESGWLTSASMVQRLEQRFAEYLGARHTLAVNSCTSALHLALEAIGIGPGDQVFVPSLTFTASAEVVRYLGAHPVLLDVDLDTGGVTTDIVREAIARHPDVKAIVLVHFGGRCLPMLPDAGDAQGLVALCRQHGIRIVEDAAHALPSRQHDRLVGTFGDITCFSFYANKTMTTGEGGLVATDNDAYAKRMQVMRLHGIDRDVWQRFTRGGSWEYDVIAPGFKYNMPDVNAAIGLAQLERLDAMHARRIEIAKRYREGLSGNPSIHLPPFPDDITSHSWHLFPIRLTPHCAVDRNCAIEQLNAAGIGTSVHYRPLHRMTYYRDTYTLLPQNYPNVEAIWHSTLSLPIYNLMSDDDVRYVCDGVNALGVIATGDRRERSAPRVS